MGAHEEKGDQMANANGFDDKVYEVQLDDYNLEYGDFKGVADRQNGLWDLYERNTAEEMLRAEAAGRTEGLGTNGTGENLWARLPRIEVIYHDADDEREGGDHDAVDRWTIRAGLGGLRTLYDDLLGELATPAWHWYGMGGDDHAYDYWPNGMAMAVQFRDQLIEAARSAGMTGQHEVDDVRDDLNRVYWLVRARWEADQRRTAPGHEYPGGFEDFLDAKEFGDREILGF